MNFDIIEFPAENELAAAVAHQWVDRLETSTPNGVPQTVALSGGRIARKFFVAMAKAAADRPGLFDAVHFFWADERAVPPDDPQSNYQLANNNLFLPSGISPARIHRIRGEVDPALAAIEAERAMRQLISVQDALQPRIHLIFLGMGEDGHIASLFPRDERVTAAAASSPAPCSPSCEFTSNPSSSVYLHVVAPKPPPHRITLSYDAIAAARDVWVIASGQDKQQAFRESIRINGTTPLAKLLQMRPHTTIFTDIPH